MANLCCIQYCGNRSTDCSLFHVPSKRFMKQGTPRWKWAFELERTLLEIRKDSHIEGLYERDYVKICEKHFEAEHIVMKGTRKELKLGAIPTLCLPKKELRTMAVPRLRPKRRNIPIPVPVKYRDLKHLWKYQIPKIWKKEKNDERIIYRLHDEYDQAKFQVDILKNFDVSASYYGWSAGPKSFIRALKIQGMTPCHLLCLISSAKLCEGVNDCSDDDACSHIITKQSDPHGLTAMPVTIILAKRSASCDIFLDESQICVPCSELDKISARTRKRKEDYAGKFLWLQALCGKRCGIGTLHAAVTTYQNLKEEKKCHEVELYFDETVVRPFLVVKYEDGLLNRVVLPMYVKESLSSDEIHRIFKQLQPPGGPDTYEDGFILGLVSSDHSIVYHNMCVGLVPPTLKPSAAIPTSRDLKRKAQTFDD